MMATNRWLMKLFKKKHHYKFNPHTLRYEKVYVGAKEALRKISFTVAFGLVVAVAFVILSYQFVDSPKERALKREIAQYKRQIKVLNTRVTRAEKVLVDLESRDDNVYRTILEATPISTTERFSGMGGEERYSELQGYDNSELITSTTLRVDELTKRLYVESKSLDELYKMAVNKQQRLEAMPCIMPMPKNSCKLVSGFGSRYHPILHYRRQHTGVDLTAKTGTPVYATAAGTVGSAGRNGEGLSGYGNVVVLNHGYGYQTLYAHLNDVVVRSGQKVQRGELIGHVGSTGLSSGPHLHYEVIKGGQKVNPVFYFFNDLNAREYEEVIEAANQENQCLS